MDRIPQSVTKRVVLKAYLTLDHVAPATGKTIAITISKNGAAFGNPSAGATNATEISNGWYYVDLSTTDTGTAGPLIVRGTSSLVDDVETSFEVANAFNAGFTGVPGVAAEGAGGLFTRGTGAGQINQAANGMIDTNPVRLNNASQSLLDLKDFADDGYDPSTNKVQGVVLTDTTTTVTNRVTANTDQIEGSDATIYFDGLGATIAAAVWAVGSRTLTSFGTLVADVTTAVWAAGTRTLTSFGTLVADTATAVWAAVSRSLTDKVDFTLTSAYDAAKTAAQPGDIPTAVQNADAMLGRNLAGGSSGGRMVKDALRTMRNRVAIAAGTVTVYEEDDTTPAWTGAVTTTSGAQPITQVDPS